MDGLPSKKALDRFAPVCDTDGERMVLELERKRSWLRGLKKKPEWTTKEEAQALPEVKMRPMLGSGSHLPG